MCQKFYSETEFNTVIEHLQEMGHVVVDGYTLFGPEVLEKLQAELKEKGYNTHTLK